MLNHLFKGIFDTSTTEVIAVSDFLLCVCCALIIGLFLAFAICTVSAIRKALWQP